MKYKTNRFENNKLLFFPYKINKFPCYKIWNLYFLAITKPEVENNRHTRMSKLLIIFRA